MNPQLLGPLLEFGKGIIDRLFPDPAQKAAAQMELLKMQQSGDLAVLASQTELAKAQIGVNAEEAKNPNWFIAGARPFVLWVCGMSFAYVTLIEPIARFVAQVMYAYQGPFPVIDTSLTMQVLFGILGLGAYRSLEKIKGAEGNR